MKFRLSSEFGVLEEVRGGRVHNGIDLAIPHGSELRAIGNGIVDKVFDGSGKIGEGLSIKLENGTRAIYGHMSDVDVQVGDKVNVGDVIGESGSSGLSTGPHLHFSLRAPDGTYLDPTPLAEPLAEMSGKVKEGFDWESLFMDGVGGMLIDKGKETLREKTSEATNEIILGILDALRDFLVDSIGAVALVGTALLIILKVAGYKDGYKWAGVLYAVNVFVKYLLGGEQS